MAFWLVVDDPSGATAMTDKFSHLFSLYSSQDTTRQKRDYRVEKQETNKKEKGATELEKIALFLIRGKMDEKEG